VISEDSNDFEISKTYVLSWDCEGLESVICISDIAREETWQALKKDHTKEDNTSGRTESVTSIVGRLVMRARFNSHRFYEIYAIDVDDGITSDDIRDWFESAPLEMADLIRKRGRKLYSDRRDKRRIRIE
jgi:hypothetical protein